jgi:hypothetical protein
MTCPASVTTWIRLLKAGDHAAAQRLWERSFEGLVRLARKKLQLRSVALGKMEGYTLEESRPS